MYIRHKQKNNVIISWSNLWLESLVEATESSEKKTSCETYCETVKCLLTETNLYMNNITIQKSHIDHYGIIYLVITILLLTIFCTPLGVIQEQTNDKNKTNHEYYYFFWLIHSTIYMYYRPKH